jgi:hypothetical protein
MAMIESRRDWTLLHTVPENKYYFRAPTGLQHRKILSTKKRLLLSHICPIDKKSLPTFLSIT